MEIGNFGASEVGAPSIGLNIVLPHEQATDASCHAGALLQLPLFRHPQDAFSSWRAKGVVVFPGGFGTLHPIFEIR